MRLVITDSLKNAKKISSIANESLDFNEIGYLEFTDYIITFSFGHLFTSIGKKFKLIDNPMYKERFDIIKTLISRKDVDLIINACSPNQEGDSIFKEIYNAIGVFKPVFRVYPDGFIQGLSSLKEKNSKTSNTNLNENVLGICPVCNQDVIEQNKFFGCSGCDFKLWKEDRFLGSMGQKLTSTLAKGLLSGESVLVKGLKSKAGKIFNARIRLIQKPNGYWSFEFEGFGS